MKSSVFTLFLLSILIFAPSLYGQVTTGGSGNWSSTTLNAPWPGGVVPTATTDVIIADGHTVTVDSTNAVCRNLTIGTTGASNTTVRWRIDGTAASLVVNGDILLAYPNSRLRAETRSPAGAANSFVAHTLTLYGNLDNKAGGTLDFRGGSNSSGTANSVELSLLGTSTSSISLSRTTYGSSNEEFNSITVNKTGGAKVILAGGNLYMSNNTSVGPTSLTLTSGLIETGSNTWVFLSTNATGIVGASSTSYVLGNLGRGMSNSSTATRTFPVGDAAGYRPITISATTSGSATGHNVVVNVVSGNANTGSSTFAGGIDKVSGVRYYQVTYVAGGGAASMGFNYFAPTYGSDDGVSAGNTDLRVAYSSNARAAWNGVSQTIPDTTNLTAPPTEISPDSLGAAVTLNDGASLFVALSRATGTTTNSLSSPPKVVALVFPKYIGGSLTSRTTLENPVACYIEFSGLEPGTKYNQAHVGFLTKGTSTVRGSKWANNTWISPSTVFNDYWQTDAEGKIKTWVYIRTPSSYFAGVDTSQLRVRVQKTGTSTNITSEYGYFTSLSIDSAATGPTAGAIVYGYTDTVSQNNVGKVMLAYENTGDTTPLSAWLIYKSPTTPVETELFTTRMHTLYRRSGYFQFVVPTNTQIRKLEVRDSINAVLRYQIGTSWRSQAAGSRTNLNLQQNIVLSVERISDFVPSEFVVSQNYPNPFNPSTTIQFSLDRAQHVSLKVHDILGREVETLLDAPVASGTYHVVWNAGGQASGVYFYTIQTENFHETRRMVLMR